MFYMCKSRSYLCNSSVTLKAFVKQSLVKQLSIYHAALLQLQCIPTGSTPHKIHYLFFPMACLRSWSLKSLLNVLPKHAHFGYFAEHPHDGQQRGWSIVHHGTSRAVQSLMSLLQATLKLLHVLSGTKVLFCSRYGI